MRVLYGLKQYVVIRLVCQDQTLTVFLLLILTFFDLYQFMYDRSAYWCRFWPLQVQILKLRPGEKICNKYRFFWFKNLKMIINILNLIATNEWIYLIWKSRKIWNLNQTILAQKKMTFRYNFFAKVLNREKKLFFIISFVLFFIVRSFFKFNWECKNLIFKYKFFRFCYPEVYNILYKKVLSY